MSPIPLGEKVAHSTDDGRCRYSEILENEGPRCTGPESVDSDTAVGEAFPSEGAGSFDGDRWNSRGKNVRSS